VDVFLLQGNVADGGKPKVFLELKYLYSSEKIKHGTNPLEVRTQYIFRSDYFPC